MENNPDYTITMVLSDSLAEETRKVIWMLRNEPHNAETGKKAVNLLHATAEVNLNGYLIEPAKELNLGLIGVKLLTMSINTILKLISSVGHKIVARLSVEQLSKLADSLEERFLTHRSGEKPPATDK